MSFQMDRQKNFLHHVLGIGGTHCGTRQPAADNWPQRCSNSAKELVIGSRISSPRRPH
jgi:hypothetical protein